MMKTLGKIVSIFFLLAFLFFLLVVLGCFYFWHQIDTPVSAQDAQVDFLIEKGTSSEEIARRLKEAGLIRSANSFKVYVWLRGWHQGLEAGQYVLSPGYDIKEIARLIYYGQVRQDVVKLTIPEGFTNKQIDERLSKSDFSQAIAVSDFKISDFSEQYDFFEGASAEKSLQGFLFPDTYIFRKDASQEEVAKKMLDNFSKKFSQELRAEILRQGKTLFDILKMASILEKEVRGKEDRQIVAGIFWQRLKIGQALESCATIAYILGQDKPRYSYEETRVVSPYNTYTNTGLPPTPINNPGLEAIEAAVYSQDSPYNYFLSDPETGQTIFARTLNEHNENKAKYFK